MYKVFNKILLGSNNHKNLTKVFDPFTLVTVLSNINETGKFENEYFIVTCV